MDSFNKVISFILGLVVVLVFFAVVTGKINLKSKTTPTSASESIVAPTPTPKDTEGFWSFLKPKTSPTPTQISSSLTISSNNNIYRQNNQVSTAKSIPSTGLPTLFIPLLFSGLAGGSLLRKAGKK